jgi:hypothetical protein
VLGALPSSLLFASRRYVRGHEHFVATAVDGGFIAVDRLSTLLHITGPSSPRHSASRVMSSPRRPRPDARSLILAARHC